MNAWLSSLPPRLQGVAALLISATVVVVGLFTARLMRTEFYPVVFPAAGFLAPMGLFQIITGYGRDDMTHRRVPGPLMGFLMLPMIVGALGGLEANRVVFGVRW
jgi:hypothetical protein